jgi:hypothetical protein
MSLTKRISIFTTVASGFFTSSVFAGNYNCGVFLDDNDEPSATASFDTDQTEATVMGAGKFTGVVQTSKDEAADEQFITMANIGPGKEISAARYSIDSGLMVVLLQTADSKKVVTGCVPAGKALVRPEIH